jgi:putative flippase GtrA
MKLVKYFLVGGFAALVDILLFALLVKGFESSWLSSAAFSFCIATLINYFLSVRHVFKSGVRFVKRNEILLVFVVSAIGLMINQAVLGVLIELRGTDVLLSKVAATGSVFFWNFGARRYFIFGEPRR